MLISNQKYDTKDDIKADTSPISKPNKTWYKRLYYPGPEAASKKGGSEGKVHICFVTLPNWVPFYISILSDIIIELQNWLVSGLKFCIFYFWNTFFKCFVVFASSERNLRKTVVKF